MGTPVPQIINLRPKGWRNHIRYWIWPPYRRTLKQSEKLINFVLHYDYRQYMAKGFKQTWKDDDAKD